jgi:xanthine dehydrogenase small subunit
VSVADLVRYEMIVPASLDEVCALLADRRERGQATALLAGGTDWLVEREAGPVLAAEAVTPMVVDVSRLDELRAITLEPPSAAGVEVLRIGAAATYLELRRSPVVQERLPLLARMSRDVGAVQIQARGTLGGNLATASPAADGVTALAALDAEVVVRSVRGVRSIAFADLQTGYKQTTRAPDEVIVAVRIALPRPGAAWVWRKVGTRRAQAISKVALAGVAEVEGGRVRRFGLGMASVAPVTARMPATRLLVATTPLGELDARAVDEAVAADVSPIDDVRSTRTYRLHCARAVTRAWLRELGAAV